MNYIPQPFYVLIAKIKYMVYPSEKYLIRLQNQVINPLKLTYSGEFSSLWEVAKRPLNQFKYTLDIRKRNKDHLERVAGLISNFSLTQPTYISQVLNTTTCASEEAWKIEDRKTLLVKYTWLVYKRRFYCHWF